MRHIISRRLEVTFRVIDTNGYVGLSQDDMHYIAYSY